MGCFDDTQGDQSACLNNQPPCASIAVRNTLSWTTSAARIACASDSHRRVEPSTSVNKNVTIPEGAAAAAADTPAECHIRYAVTLHIEGTRPRDTQVLPARGQSIGRPKRLTRRMPLMITRPLNG